MVPHEIDVESRLHSSAAMRLFFNDTVLPAVFPGRIVRAVKRRHVSYPASGGCSVLYSLRFTDDPRSPRLVNVSVGQPAKLEELYARHYGGQPEAGEEGLAYLAPGAACLVEFFPATWRLPGLAFATDPRRMAELLSEGSGDAPADEVTVQMIRYRPDRSCVLRYEIGPGGRGGILFGKVYRPGARALRIWQKLVTFHDQGRALGIAVPQPIRLVEEWSLVLMGAVEGDRFKDVLRRSETSDQLRRAVEAAARGLAAFQRLRLDTDEVRTLPSLAAELGKRTVRLAEIAPAAARTAEPLVAQVRELAERSPRAVLSTIHGDFKPSQIFVQDDRLSVVDLDRACRGDPALDVGSFLAVLHKKGWREGREHYRPLAAMFLAACQSESADPHLAERARVAQCLSLVRMAVNKLEAHTMDAEGDAKSSRPAALLEEAAVCLAAL